MGLSCSCDDFDKGEHDRWWEPGSRLVPPAGTRCCECCAPLPATPHACIVHFEVYNPEDEIEPRPPHPEDVLDDEPEDFNLARHWAQRYDAMEQAQEDYDRRHGWDSDYERFERVRSRDYRCERCDDLADAIEALGYCMIPPGELIESHLEYAEEHGTGNLIWKPFAGVWHPYKRIPEDDLRDGIKLRLRRARFWLRYGWKNDLRWKLLPAIERRTIGPVMHFAVWRRKGPPDGMTWIRQQMVKDGFIPTGWHERHGGWNWKRRITKQKEIA